MVESMNHPGAEHDSSGRRIRIIWLRNMHRLVEEHDDCFVTFVIWWWVLLSGYGKKKDLFGLFLFLYVILFFWEVLIIPKLLI